MKQCRNCGTVNNDSASFCRMCGSGLEQKFTASQNTQTFGNGGSMNFKQPESKNNSTALVVVIGILSALIVVFVAILIVVGVSSAKNNGNAVGGSNGQNVVQKDKIKKANDESDELLPEQKKQTTSKYKLYKSNATWSEAHNAATAQGGFLACVNSYDEFNKLCSMADANNLKVFWIGARRDNDNWGSVNWISGEPMTYTNWHPNEPSYVGGGTEERYLMVFKVDGVWYYNDAPNNVANVYSGKMGYIVEFR